MAGRYGVFIVYAPNPNRATNVPVVIRATDGEHRVTVNQRSPLKDNKPLGLGTYPLAVDGSAWVEIRNDGTDGFVIADAVQFVPAK
jgi:hypothetical protein